MSIEAFSTEILLNKTFYQKWYILLCTFCCTSCLQILLETCYFITFIVYVSSHFLQSTLHWSCCTLFSSVHSPSRFMVKPHASDIRMTYEYKRVTYWWDTSTYEWHTDDIRVHASDIRMTYEYIRVTYGWHTSTNEWHTDEIRVHTSDTRMTYTYIRVIYGWHRSKYESHTVWHTSTCEWHMDNIRVHASDIRVHMSDMRMTYEGRTRKYDWHANNIRNNKFGAFTSLFSKLFVLKTLLYSDAKGFWLLVCSHSHTFY